VDLERATFLVIPPNAAERAAGEAVKRDRARAVALQPELVVLLRRWQDDADGDWLWPEPVRDLGRHSTSALRAHLTALGITQGERVFHSLRHSHCSLALAAGEDGLRLRLSVGHAGDAMTAHYAAQAMRWRGEVAGWGGVWRLRGR
jgi:integrase